MRQKKELCNNFNMYTMCTPYVHHNKRNVHTPVHRHDTDVCTIIKVYNKGL